MNISHDLEENLEARQPSLKKQALGGGSQQIKPPVRQAWFETISDWGMRGPFQYVIAFILTGSLRLGLMLFWDNVFATLVSAIALWYAFIHRADFNPFVLAGLGVVAAVFQAPLIYLFGATAFYALTQSNDTTDEKVERQAAKVEVVIEDMQKPLQLGGMATLVIIILVLCVAGRGH